MALLALAQAVVGDAIEVATIDHGLRAEAAEECALVMQVCRSRGLRCEVLSVSLAGGNLQEQARLARYRALGEWAGERGLSAIATAHHADDQAETLLMRLNRGSGLSGLAGIREKALIAGSDIPVLRPLLGFRRAELLDLLASIEAPFVEDPSNRDDRFERVRVRKALSEADWLDPAAVARSAAHLAEAEATLQALADDLWAQRAQVGENEISVPRSPSADLTARLLLRAIDAFGGRASHGQLISFLKRMSGRGNFAGVLIEEQEACFICRREPPRHIS